MSVKPKVLEVSKGAGLESAEMTELGNDVTETSVFSSRFVTQTKVIPTSGQSNPD